MKYIYQIIMLCLLFGVVSKSFSQDDSGLLKQISIDDPSKYLPDYLSNIYIGIPLADFKSVKDTLLLDMSRNISDMWFGAAEEVNKDGIDEIIYKFDKEENVVNSERPLYEINIKFLQSSYQNDYLNLKFGNAAVINISKNREWIFKTNKNYRLIIIARGDTVQIIATMAGTEWDTNNPVIK